MKAGLTIATLAAMCAVLNAQVPSQFAVSRPANDIEIGGQVRADSLHSTRKAAKCYLTGVKLMEKGDPEAAWKQLHQSAELEPANSTYVRAAELARQSAVTKLVQQASRQRALNDETGATKLLQEAKALDPQNPLVIEHGYELPDQPAAARVGASVIEDQDSEPPLAPAIRLEPNKEKHSFHVKSNARQVVEQVFKSYGIDAAVHESVLGRMIRLDVDDVEFADAAKILGLVTHTFYEPLDPHRVIVAADTQANRQDFERQEVETLYLPGLNEKQLTDVGNLARNVFNVRGASVHPTKNSVTVRAPSKTMTAFNETVGKLESGQNQLDLDVKVIQLSHISARETGTTFFQQTGLYNVYSEVANILQQNQSAVQQILQSGVVANANSLANQIEIVAILLASGQLTGTPFNQGFLPFGGGLTQSVLTPGPATLNFSLNSSTTQLLDDIHMRLQDDEAGTFKIGERYPIETSQFSSTELPSIPGLTAAASALQGQTVPQIQYQDLGLTLKATPKVLRSDDVAISMELKIESLGGSSLNDIPILDSQQFSGVLTLRAGETALLLSDLSKQESRAINGLPGISDIPGLQDVSDISRNQNVARLLILVTPRVVREPDQKAGHGPRLPVPKSTPVAP